MNNWTDLLYLTMNNETIMQRLLLLLKHLANSGKIHMIRKFHQIRM
jgi:hypothetical protein